MKRTPAKTATATELMQIRLRTARSALDLLLSSIGRYFVSQSSTLLQVDPFNQRAICLAPTAPIVAPRIAPMMPALNQIAMTMVLVSDMPFEAMK